MKLIPTCDFHDLVSYRSCTNFYSSSIARISRATPILCIYIFMGMSRPSLSVQNIAAVTAQENRRCAPILTCFPAEAIQVNIIADESFLEQRRYLIFSSAKRFTF